MARCDAAACLGLVAGGSVAVAAGSTYVAAITGLLAWIALASAAAASGLLAWLLRNPGRE
jgi:hypothetical protein